MKRIGLVALALGFAAVPCLRADTLNAAGDAQTSSTQPNSQPSAVDVRAVMSASNRTGIAPGIAHYTYSVRTGRGEYDAIRLHRIVREKKALRPRPGHGAVMILPGSANLFESIFLPKVVSEVATDERNFAVYLAQRGVDVWGMDYGWALVPADATDFSAFKDWGVVRDARDAEIALSVARAIRRQTGQGGGRLALMGYSYGGMVSYALAGAETQVPLWRRNVDRLVIADVGILIDDPTYMQYSCDLAVANQAQIDAGNYMDSTGSLAEVIGGLAIAAPDGDSPIIPGFTNEQLGLVFGAETYAVDNNPVGFHFVASEVDDTGSVRLLYTEPRLWFDVLASLPPYMPQQQNLDFNNAFCGAPVSFDDHLGEIELPIFYAGAAGGIGDYGRHSLALVASDDITDNIVDLLPERGRDFGHGDLFFARNAPALAWQPIVDWLNCDDERE